MDKEREHAIESVNFSLLPQCSATNLIFHLEKRQKDKEKFVYGGKKVYYPNYEQINRIFFNFYERK